MWRFTFFIIIACFIGDISPQASNKIILYYLPPSPPCRSVMMTARALGVDLQLNLTNLMKGEHMTPEFLKMNPQHTIPTIDDNGFILWESRAIMAYLVNAYGVNDEFYPKEPHKRAIVDQRLNFDVGILFPRFLNFFKPMMLHKAPFNEELGEKLKEALGWLDKMIEGNQFVAGEKMTIADFSIITTITNLDVINSKYFLSSFENIQKWYERNKASMEPYGYTEIDVAGAKILASFIS